jgi:hypothetical protein
MSGRVKEEKECKVSTTDPESECIRPKIIKR